MAALPIYYRRDFTADDVNLDYMSSALIAGNTGFLRIYDDEDCMTVLTNDTHPLWSKVMAMVSLWPSTKTRLGDTLYRKPAIALLPAVCPLPTQPTPARMSINRRVAGENGVLVTGLTGESIALANDDDLPRAIRQLVPDSYAAAGMADPTPTIDGSTPVLPCDVPAPAVEVKALYCWPRDLSAGDVIRDGNQEYTITYVRQPDAGKRCGSIAVQYADGARGLISVDWQPLTLSNMVIVAGPKMDAARQGRAHIERRMPAGSYVWKGSK